MAVPYGSVQELKTAYRFQKLQDFLDLYYQGMRVLREEQDFYELAWSYFEKARRQNVLHAEVFFDPQAHTRRGIPFARVIDGIHRAASNARTHLGLSIKLIMCFLRDLSPQDALHALEQAMPYRDRIIAVGLDSAERGNPPSRFKEVFAQARDAGFHTVAHAGEEGPAEYIRQALDILKVDRIDHGVRCLEDAELVERLTRARIPLTVCPLSNVRLNVVDDMPHHPLREMMEKGLLVTVNSDDPAYFGGYVNENYQAVAEALAIDTDGLCTLARNSFLSSFLSEGEKEYFIAKVAVHQASGAT